MSRPHQKLLKLLLSTSLLFSSLFLTACIDLAGTQSLAKNQNFVFHSKAQVFVMRGGLGGIFSTGMNQLQRRLERNYQIKTESTVWYKANDLSKFIIKNYGTKQLAGPIVLVGHSLGANEQIKVAQNLNKYHIPVALIITVDAVSPLKVSPNVKQVVNIYKPSFVPLFSGLLVRAMDPSSTKINNINVDTYKKVAVNHFTIDKNVEIQQLMVNNILDAVAYSKKDYLAKRTLRP
ncbi:MAG: hypothetical protein H0U70_05030 [Tatlockia sp.]|nr:hypothetical protein [Tatlockia sp.]